MGGDRLDRGDVRVGEGHLGRGDVLLQVAAALGAGDGDRALVLDPGERQLTMVLAAAQAWFWAAEGSEATAHGQSWSSQRLAQHRSTVVEAARRLIEPRATPE